MRYLFQHCPYHCRIYGGRCYFGDIFAQMIDDGLTHKTAALAMHGLSVLQPGAVEAIGLDLSDEVYLEDTAHHCNR